MRRVVLYGFVWLAVWAVGTTRLFAAASDVVLYAGDAATVQGNWSRVSDGSAAGGQRLSSVDYGWSTTDDPLASPS